VTHLEGSLAQAQDLPVGEIYRRFGAGVDAESIEWCPALGPPQDMVGGMQRNQRQGIERIGNCSGPTDVVKVGVCVPKVGDPPAAGKGLGQMI
jgi:hypothetical protein